MCIVALFCKIDDFFLIFEDNLSTVIEEGLGKALAVSLAGKLTTTWGDIKAQIYVV